MRPQLEPHAPLSEPHFQNSSASNLTPRFQNFTVLRAALISRWPCPRALAGWVQADLRGPLPPLDELDRLRVGLRDGHTLHLCRADEAVGFASIERSLDFSEHYGVLSS